VALWDDAQGFSCSACLLDLNGDFTIDAADLMLALPAWQDPSAGLNFDTHPGFDIRDLLEMQDTLGPCP